MYVPKHFAEERLDVLHEYIVRSGFATLVTLGPTGLVATHLPLVLHADEGVLRGHVARGNPQWRDVGSEHEALAIFLGPDTYISPTWYPTKSETGKVVPTWNYVAVHVYGRLSAYDDPVRLREHVTRLTRTHEMSRSPEWRVSDAPDDFVDGMLKGIVGLELTLSRIEGKWKMSQNRPEADRLGAIAGLEASGLPTDASVAEVMQTLAS